MTPPLQIVAGRIYFVTRRTHRRVFHLRPSNFVNQLFQYLLAVGAERYALGVVGVVVQSNHFHLIVEDTEGRLPAFLQWFDSLLARALNANYRTRDSVWSYAPPHIAWLPSAAAVIQKLGYMAANPVEAGAVERGRDWPGVRSNPNYYTRPVTVDRPLTFFGRKSRLPERATLHLSVPSTHSDLEPNQFAGKVADAIGEAESAARGARAEKDLGWIGREACLSVDAATEASRAEEFRARIPGAVIEPDPELLSSCREKIAQFREAYAVARDRLLRGVPEILWPFGTWKMRVHYAATTAAAPST